MTRLVLWGLALLSCAPIAHAAAQDGAETAARTQRTGEARTPSEAPSHAASAGRRDRSRSSRHKKSNRSRVSSAYELLRASWHEPAPEALCEQVRAALIPDLVFHVQSTAMTYVLKPSSREGGFDAAQLELAKQAFGSWTSGPTPHPRVLDLIYAAVLHFEVPYVHLISGVRHDRKASRHSHGLAADIVLPGVDDEELAAFFRAQGFVGVGTYPRSGFVHVDTRDESFFWIDSSSPGARGRVKGVRAEEAKLVDEAALMRGSETFVNPPRLERALHARAARRNRARAQRAESVAAASESSSERSTQ